MSRYYVCICRVSAAEVHPEWGSGHDGWVIGPDHRLHSLVGPVRVWHEEGEEAAITEASEMADTIEAMIGQRPRIVGDLSEPARVLDW